MKDNRTQFQPGVRSYFHFLLTAVLLASIILIPTQAAAAQSSDTGFRGFAYPRYTGGNSDATGEKPESKLWWNDGFWYGCLWSTAGNAYHIHRLDTSTQTWIDTGVAIDNRLSTKADVLWDGTKLYVVSHVFVTTGVPAPAGERGQLYRYSYYPSSKTYALDSGFPVEVTRGKSETLVIDKDSTGTLWVTYVENSTVMVNRSVNGDDRVWRTPFALPAGGAEVVNSDDISSIITYNNHVGIMWSNQRSPRTMYFAVHPVNSPDTNWTRVRAFSVSADDHINLKSLESDQAGNVFAVVKTSRAASLIMVLVCRNNINRCRTEADWVPYTVYDSETYNPTRPMMMIDETNRHLYVFTRNEDNDGSRRGGIYYKRANLDNIAFPSGMGTPFIRTSLDVDVNDPTSTKQNVNAATGLVVLASDTRTRIYLHNYLSLGGTTPPPQPPSISGFNPSSGPAGTEVTVNGANFTQVNAVRFNGAPAQSYVVDSSSQIRAVVPTGATSGPVQVTTAAGSASSAGSFTVTVPPPPQYTLSVTTTGSGTVALSPPGGSYPAGTVVTLTAQPAAGWQFQQWQGHLSGSANPASVTMDASKSVTAVFVQSSGGGGGPVAFGETVSGTALSSNTVTTTGNLSGSSSSLYLAAVSSRNSAVVQSVSGLGLTWTRVDQQCAGRNQTMIEVWAAQGVPGDNGQVMAQFTAQVKSAMLVVTRYSGVNASQPFGSIMSGNTVGLEAACSGGVDSNAYAFQLPASANGGIVYVAASMRNRTHTPGAGYTERADLMAGSGGDVTSIAVQDRPLPAPASVPVNGTFSGTVDWAIVVIEIRPEN